MMDDMKNKCCDPAFQHCDFSPNVIIERILKPYYNPDGSFSRRKYYQYPISCFKAIHQAEDIHSPTLDTIIQGIVDKVNGKQNKIAAGSQNTILTRGMDDGRVGELTKIDYTDEERMSKRHIPSEYALFNALANNNKSLTGTVKEEADRAKAEEAKLKTSIDDEHIRALDAETDISKKLEDKEASLLGMIDELDKKTLKSDALDKVGMVMTDFSVNAENIEDIHWAREKIDLITGTVDRREGNWNLKDDLDRSVESAVTKAMEDYTNSLPVPPAAVTQSIFNNTNGKLVANSEFAPGFGEVIGRLSTVKKDVVTGDNTNTTVTFKSTNISSIVNSTSPTEQEIELMLAYNNDLEIKEMFTEIYA